MARLDALLQAQGYCKGRTCGAPWAVLHPDGGVAGLEQAMQAQYDALYAGLTKFAWQRCERGYEPVKNEVKDARLYFAARSTG